MSNWIRTPLLLATLAIHSAGCGLLIGNVKPVEEKSEAYRVLDLSRDSPDWEKLASVNESTQAPNPDGSEISDVAYQSKKSASIISLNSACRASNVSSEISLQEFTRELLLGISDVTQRTERSFSLQETPALETTLQGNLNGERVMLRTVVLRSGECVYDLMYVSRPEQFAAQESDFSRFVNSLRLRK